MHENIELKTAQSLSETCILKFKEQLAKEWGIQDCALVGVQTIIYFAVRKSDGKIVGYIELRHPLNEDLRVIGGNIGYYVLSAERRKGYATRMLRLVLDEAKEMGMDKLLLTVAAENTASVKVIRNSGGVLEREEPFVYDREMYYKYWIYL